MRSRADRARRLVEHALRAVAFLALAALLWRAVRPQVQADVAVARGDLEAALVRWTSTPPGGAHVVFDRVPEPETRDWLRALDKSGTPVRWSAARPIPASAVVTEPTADPYGATRLRVATNAGEPVALTDAAGLIDTLPNGGAAELELAAVSGDVRARGATFVAATASRDSAVLRPVVVLGTAGWEAKFTIAALEEAGWRVAARLRVAPGVEVTQGDLGPIDTARYSAVIALDSSAAATGSTFARYARSGGGVVLAGNAGRAAGLASIAPGNLGSRLAGVAGAVASEKPRSGLAAFTVASLRADAVPLEPRGEATVVAARRVGAGRVLQMGYDETWRWRMSGGDEAVRAHREWWSRVVASVAYTPLVPRAAAIGSMPDEVPLAALYDALGEPVPVGQAGLPMPDPSRATRLLFALVVGGLLLEWVSRRLRGAR
jgi:hypothetical protein